MKTLMKNKKCMALSALTAVILNVSVAQAATHEAFLIPTTDVALNSSAMAIGEDGNVAVTVTGTASNTTQFFAPANIPIDITLLDFEDPSLAILLSDVEAVMNGVISEDDFIILATFVLSNNPLSAGSQINPERQRVARLESYLGDQNGATALPILDVFDSDIGDVTRSVNSVINKVIDQNTYLGEANAPYLKVDFVLEDGEEVRLVFHEFADRGFVVMNDQLIELPPLADQAGGWSTATDMNNNLLVAGSMSVNALEGTQTAVDACNDDDIRGDIPVEVCLSLIADSFTVNAGFPGILDFNEELIGYNIEGVLWQLDTSGNIVDTTTLGFIDTGGLESTLLDPFSRAFAVNDQGIAVGESLDFANGDVNQPSSFAAVFMDGEAIAITDVNEFNLSSAIDINNNNIVAGQAQSLIAGRLVSKLFTFNVDTGEITFPEDFFSSSDVDVSAINDAGLVVGSAESDFTTTQQRRRSGFIFNPLDDTFLNINDLLECDSPFDVISASDVNENGEIAATALIRTDIRSPITLNDVTVGEGAQTEEDVLVALRLVPIPGGVIDDCTEFDAAENPSAERNGAAFGGGIMILTLLGIFRRRFSR
jgi:hypothetical protein